MDLYPVVYYTGSDHRRKELTARGIAVLHELEVTQAGLQGRKVFKRYSDGVTILAITTENAGMRNDFLTINVPVGGEPEIKKDTVVIIDVVPVPEVFYDNSNDVQNGWWIFFDRYFNKSEYAEVVADYTYYDDVLDETILAVYKKGTEEKKLDRIDNYDDIYYDYSAYSSTSNVTYDPPQIINRYSDTCYKPGVGPPGTPPAPFCTQPDATFGICAQVVVSPYELVCFAPNRVVTKDPSSICTFPDNNNTRMKTTVSNVTGTYYYVGCNEDGDEVFIFFTGPLQSTTTTEEEKWGVSGVGDSDFMDLVASEVQQNMSAIVPESIGGCFNLTTGDCAMILEKKSPFTKHGQYWNSPTHAGVSWPYSATCTDSGYTKSLYLWFNNKEYKIWESPVFSACSQVVCNFQYCRDIKIYKTKAGDFAVVFGVIHGKTWDGYTYDRSNCFIQYGMLYKGVLTLSDEYPVYLHPVYTMREIHNWEDTSYGYGAGYIHAAVKQRMEETVTILED